MDYLQTCVNQYQRGRSGRPGSLTFVPLSSLIKPINDGSRRQYYRVQRVLNIIEQMEASIRSIYNDSSLSKRECCELAQRERQACIEYIGSIAFTFADMSYLLTEIEKPRHSRIYRRVFDILFGYPNTSFYALIEEASDAVYDIVPDRNGGIILYGMPYEVVKKSRYFVQKDADNL